MWSPSMGPQFGILIGKLMKNHYYGSSTRLYNGNACASRKGPPGSVHRGPAGPPGDPGPHGPQVGGRPDLPRVTIQATDRQICVCNVVYSVVVPHGSLAIVYFIPYTVALHTLNTHIHTYRHACMHVCIER